MNKNIMNWRNEKGMPEIEKMAEIKKYVKQFVNRYETRIACYFIV